MMILRKVVLFTVLVIYCFFVNALWGQTRRTSTFDELMKPSVSRTSADEIIRKIPWQSLSPSNQQRLKAIVTNHTLYRRLPMAGGYCNPEMFDFLVCHPEIVVGFWETLGFTDLSLQKIGPHQYSVREKVGTTGKIEIIFHTDELLIAWCEGVYRGPMISSEIVGEMAIILQTRYTEDTKGNPLAICRLDSFVRAKNIGVDIMGRVFGPILGKVADSNFEQTFTFMADISKAAEETPASLRETMRRTRGIALETQNDFITLTDRVFAHPSYRADGTLTAYYLFPKMNQPTKNIARILAKDGVQPQRTSEMLPIAPVLSEKQNTNTSVEDELFFEVDEEEKLPPHPFLETAGLQEDVFFLTAPLSQAKKREIPSPILLEPPLEPQVKSHESKKVSSETDSVVAEQLVSPLVAILSTVSSKNAVEPASSSPTQLLIPPSKSDKVPLFSEQKNKTEIIPENTWRTSPTAP